MFRWFVFHIIFSFSYCIFEVMSLHWLQSRASLKSISPLWSCLLCSFSVSAVPPPPGAGLPQTPQPIRASPPGGPCTDWSAHGRCLALGNLALPRTSPTAWWTADPLLLETISSPLLPFSPAHYGWESGPERTEDWEPRDYALRVITAVCEC